MIFYDKKLFQYFSQDVIERHCSIFGKLSMHYFKTNNIKFLDNINNPSQSNFKKPKKRIGKLAENLKKKNVTIKLQRKLKTYWKMKM